MWPTKFPKKHFVLLCHDNSDDDNDDGIDYINENVFTVDDSDVNARCSMMMLMMEIMVMSATNLKVLPLSVNLQSRLTTCCDGDTK